MNVTIKLRIQVKQNVTVLPRILQVFSRRSIVMRDLMTNDLRGGRAELWCTIQTTSKWEESIPDLLSRLVDVENVEIMNTSKM